MHHSHRTWFPYILIGLSIALLLVVIVVNKDGRSNQIEPAPVLEDYEYEDAVHGILDLYNQEEDKQVAYDSLLNLRISESQKQVHLDLVLMFGKLMNNEIDSIDSYIVELDEIYPWLIN